VVEVARRRELVILAAVALLLTVAVYLLLIRPKLGQAAAARADRQRAVIEGQALRTQIAALEDVRANAAALKERARTARDLFPGTPDLPDLVNALQRVADQSGVLLVSVQPAPPAASAPSAGSSGPSAAPGSGSSAPSAASGSGSSGPSAASSLPLATMSTAVNVRGGYFQIEDFLARLEGMVKSPDPASRIPPRSILVRSVNLTRGGGQAGTGGPSGTSAGAGRAGELTATIDLVAFQTVKPAARPGAGAAGTGAGAGSGSGAAGAPYVPPSVSQRR
jgi:hypothetical protein